MFVFLISMDGVENRGSCLFIRVAVQRQADIYLLIEGELEKECILLE
jgi:hypothetical protein